MGLAPGTTNNDEDDARSIRCLYHNHGMGILDRPYRTIMPQTENVKEKRA